MEEIDTKLIQAAAVRHLLAQNDAFKYVGEDTISNGLWVIGDLLEDAKKLLKGLWEEDGMTTYDEFCQHYNLEADNPDSREQYRQYREPGDLMRSIVGGGRHRGHLQEQKRNPVR